MVLVDFLWWSLMSLLRVIKSSLFALVIELVAPLSLAATPHKATVGKGSTQQVIHSLQTKIQAVSNSIPKQLAKQQK